MAEEDFIDLYEIVVNYLPTVDGQIPWKSGKVDWSIDRRYFHVSNDGVQHEEAKTAKCDRTSSVLFRSTYRNTMNSPMEYSIDQTRRTVTDVSCTITKGLRYGGSFELDVSPPNIASLKIGASNEVSFEKCSSESRQEEMSWTFQTTVPVPASKAVTAELSVLEEHRQGKFTLRSYFSGKILVDWVYKKKRGQLELTDLTDLLIGTSRKRNLGFQKDGKGRIFFQTEGVCTCHYGLEQDVIIREVELDQCDSSRRSSTSVS